MAESDETYLRECLQSKICPTCQTPFEKGVGGGQPKDGLFCSLDCYAKWHEEMLIRRHRNRLVKPNTDE
jgi:hypothetical protein